MSSVVEIINHYQKSIEKSLSDKARLLHCISKLYRLPVSVQHLQETGVGRTVNGLRKYDGEVGVAAKALVTKWKTMVADEESDEGVETQNECHETNDSSRGDDDDNNCEEEARNDEPQLDVDDQNNQHSEIDEIYLEKASDERCIQMNEHDSSKYSASDGYRTQRVALMRESINEQQESSHTQYKTESNRSRSSSKDSQSRNRNRPESKREEYHSSKNCSPSSKRLPEQIENEKMVKHRSRDSNSNRSDSSQTCGKEDYHGRSKEHSKFSSKHHSSTSKVTSSVENGKRQRTLDTTDECKPKKHKKETSEKLISSSSQHRSNSSKSCSSSRREKEKVKRSSEKRKERSSDEDDDGLDGAGGASFADALAMIGMPSSSKRKSTTRANVEKPKNTSASMPPPATKSNKEKQQYNRDSFSPSSTASSSGYSSCSSTPTLLVRKAKLEPLPEISEIVESLPIISPHYKPMPLNQTVMDCVFSNNGRPQKKVLSEEEALGHSMQSKNLRTKVYSGVKNSKEGVPKLFDMCIRLLQENIDLIDTFGGIPFDLLKPVIEKATAQQLMKLELFNPYLLEDTDILWEQHCKRMFRSQKRKEEECESWREMYIRCSEERDAKLISLTQNIKQSIVEKTAPVRKTKLAYVDSNAKPPRNVLSKQVKYGTDRAPIVSPAARVAALQNSSANIAKVGDSRLKIAPGTRDNAQVQVFHPLKPKKAPLMAKLMTSIKGFKTGFRR
ncbi:transcription elongation factor B polypeptide 3 [Sabethes cyaneus]|uniref:transcription elongation factor B polypeptide 3 n=1 Tax=Sabethes cyaneus TaxID=53552 RepID=UPI00221E2D98|nr:transcription elongation factor B polypeptide 3 [Sabethes cyaneus]